MKAFSVVIGAAFTLALLAGLVVGGKLLWAYMVAALGTLDSQLATLIVIASVVAVLCAAIIAGGLKSANQGDRSLPNCGFDKAVLYIQLLSHTTDCLRRRLAPGGTESDGGILDLEHQLALHGNPKVIAAYMSLRRLTMGGNPQSAEVSTGLTTLVKEMRADLGRPLLIFRQDDVLDLLRYRDD